MGLSRRKISDLEGAILVNWLWISFQQLAILFLRNSLDAGETSLQFLDPPLIYKKWNKPKFLLDCFLFDCMQWFKVIPQKYWKLPMNFFETFPECSLPSTVSKNAIKMIGHHSRLRDLMGQSYLICACTQLITTVIHRSHVTFWGSSKHSL